MKHTSFKNKQIAYKSIGNGPALVLVHGFPMDHRVWRSFMKPLSVDFQVIAIDLPGFGKSDQLAEKHDMTLMAEAIEAVLDAEKIEKCVLIGHSMGGYVSLAFTKLFPSCIIGLGLFHSQAMADSSEAQANRNAAIEEVKNNTEGFSMPFVESLFTPKFAKDNPQEVEKYKLIVKSQSTNAIVAALAGMRDRESHNELLEKLNHPVLFILGKGDSRMPVDKIMEQVKIPQHAELLLLDHVAHMGFAEAEKVTLQAIKYFALKCYEL